MMQDPPTATELAECVRELLDQQPDTPPPLTAEQAAGVRWLLAPTHRCGPTASR
jgi:hypothetical protein